MNAAEELVGSLVKKNEIAEIHGVTERTVNRWMTEGMPHHKLRHSVWFDREEVMAWRRGEASKGKGIQIDGFSELPLLVQDYFEYEVRNQHNYLKNCLDIDNVAVQLLYIEMQMLRDRSADWGIKIAGIEVRPDMGKLENIPDDVRKAANVDILVGAARDGKFLAFIIRCNDDQEDMAINRDNDGICEIWFSPDAVVKKSTSFSYGHVAYDIMRYILKHVE